MALKNFNEQKFRKKDGMPYGFKADRASSIQEQQVDDAELQRNDYENRIAEARKARSNPSMQRLLASDEYQQKQREYSQRAIELAKANAGDDRTTAYKKPQTVSDYSGLGTLPTYSGMNTAANGADIDYTEVNKKAAENGKGWKGFGNSNEETISQEEALKNATATVEPYIKDKEVKQILDRYVEVSNAHDQAKATSGLRWFKNIDKAVWGSTLDEPKQQLIEKTGLSDEEADKLLRHYKYYANNQLHEEQRKAIDELPTSAKVALTPLASLESITGNFLGGIAVKDSDTKDPELGRDYNSASFGFRNLGNDIKESLHEDINESDLADWQKTVLNKGYDVGTMAGESFVTALYPGKVGLLSYGTGSYADNLQEAENRGLTKGQAQSYATTMGVAEVATEMIPFNHLSNLIKNGAGKEAVKGSLKPIFKEVLVQMNEEGTEELANDVIDVIADSLINQDKSKLNISINNYMAEGLSKDEATSKAYKDIALQAADDYLTGALSGGLSAGAAVGVYTGQTTSIGRDIAKNNEYLTKDTESPYYISENKEDYDSDASYEQAQATRQELMAAAEKLANKQKISGQEARAIYQDTTDVLENKRIQAENRAKRAEVEQAEANEEFNPAEENEVDEYQAPAKNQEEVVNDIEWASTPYQLAKAVESVTDMTPEIQELIDFKKEEIKTYFKEDIDNVITPKKAFEMGQRGEEITEEQLKSIPEVDRQEVLESNNRQFNKAILKENPNAVADTTTGKYFVPKDVTTNGSYVVIVDTEGNEHTEFSNPRISALEDAFSKTSRNYETGRPTNENLYNVTVQQAAYAVDMAINSPEATAALITTATERIFDAASVGHRSWADFKKQSNGLFTKIDEKSAEKLYNQIREDARKSDTVKSKNTQGKKTHNEVVSKTLRDNLDEASVALLESFGKKIGYDFVASTSKDARGDINPAKRTISVGSNNLSELWSISTHEGIAEYLQAHGNEADVLAIQDDMFKYLENKLGEKQFNDLINLYQSAYRTGAESEIDKNKSRRAAANEMFNDTVFALMSSEEGLNDFVNWVTDNKTASEQVSILSRVKDFFNKLFEYIQNYINSGSFNAAEKAALEMDAKTAKDFRDRIFKAMDAAIDTAKNSEGVENNSDRYSKKVSNEDLVMLSTNKKISNEFVNVLNRLDAKENVSLNDIYAVSEVAEGLRKLALKEETINKPGREILRNKLVSRLLQNNGFAEKADMVYNGITEKGFKASLVLGLPASGKSSVITNDLLKLNKACLLDSDEAKKAIPEYDNGWGAGAVHEESKLINKALTYNVLVDGTNVVIPVVGGESTKTLINQLKEAGYTVDVHFVEVIPETSLSRLLKRFITQNRFLDPKLVFNYGNKPSEVYEEVKGVANEYSKWSNEVAEGEKPRNIETGINKTTRDLQEGREDRKGRLGEFSSRSQKEKAEEHFRKSIKVDSAGNELSKGQQKYFADSKVVDENGNLMVVYHGSPNEFTEFKHDFIGSTGAAEGKGFYFTNNNSMAEGYSRQNRGQVLEGYLNISNPLSLEKITLTKPELKKYLKEVDPTGDEMLSDYDTQGGEGYPSKAWYDRALNDTVNALMQFNTNDADIAAELFNMLGKNGLLSFKDILGYDGFIAKDKYPDAEVYVAFDSNQFKNIDNLNPTDSADIRYSKKIDQDYMAAVDAGNVDQMQQMVDDAAKRAGYDSPKLYHGTDSFGFTSFDLNKMDDKQTIFLTNNNNIAATYSGTTQNKAISEKFGDIESIPNNKLADALNNAIPDDGTGRHYEYFNQDDIKALRDKALKGIENVFASLDELLKTTKEEKALKAVKRMREIQMLSSAEDILDKESVNKDFSTMLFMATHHTETFKDNNNWKELEQAIRKAYALTNEVSKSETEFIVDNYLDGYLFDVWTPKEARVDLKENVSKGNYSLYAKLGNSLVIDAEGKNWNELRNWSKSYTAQFNKDNTLLKRFENMIYLMTSDGEILRDIKENDFTKLLSDEELHQHVLNTLDSYYAIITEHFVTTRDVVKFAKKHGYDSVVFKNIKDNGGRNSKIDYDEIADVYALFNPNNVKSADPITYDDNNNIIPLSKRFDDSNEDLRKSIKVDWDNQVIDIPARTFNDDVFFSGTDEEIADAEKQEVTIKAYYANLMDSKGFRGFTFSFKDGRGDMQERILTRSTREGVDWQYSKRRNGLPVGHDNYINENDDIYSYATWPNNTLAALYNELLADTPKDGQRVYVIREGAAEEARKSIKVYGEASPYADSINETKVIQTMLGSMNSALQQADAFEVPNDTYLQIEKSILKKYNANLEDGELAANISFAFAYMSQNKLDTNYESMMNYLLNIGDEVIKNSNLKDPESVKTYDDAKNILKSYTFKLSDQDRAEIKHVFGGNWQTAFGELNKAGIKLNNNSGVDVDTVFTQLQSEFLQTTGINLEKFDKPSEQILGILDSMKALEPTAYLWDGANDMDKALTVAADIIDAYYSNATGQLVSNVIKGTKKGNEKITQAINKEKTKLNQKFNEYKANKTDEFNQIVAEKNRIIQEQQNQIKQQNDMMRKWNRDLSEKDKQLQQQKVLSEKQIRQNARLEAQKAVQSYKEREERARQMDNIRKSGIRMIKWLTQPTDAQHVPAFLQRPLAEFLAAIDFLPTNAKADSKSTLTWQQRMNDLREVLVKIKDAEIEGNDSAEAYFAQSMVAKDIIAMLDDFLGKESWDEFTQSYIVTKRTAKKVSLLNAAELAKLNKIMSALSTSINNMNKTLANDKFKSIDELAKVSYGEIKEMQKDRSRQNIIKHVISNFAIAEETPVYFFENLGKGAKSVFDELRQGWNLRTEHIRETEESIEEFKKRNNIKDSETSKWSKHINDFELSEGKISLTDAQIMSLYETVKRKQGRPHVMLGGIRPANNRVGVNYLHSNKAVHINAGDYQKIISVLSDKQILMADYLQQYMANDCAKWGNRVAKVMYGYNKFLEEDYFPLKTDAYSRGVTPASDNNVSYNAIKNMSAAKPIAPNANNAVMLDDIFNVFSGHIEQMANYDGFLLPLSDAMRWFNYSEKVVTAMEEGNRVDVIANMQEAIDGALGEAGNKYFRTFIKNINGIYEGKGGSLQFADILASGYKAQAVMANLRVVAQQPMAVARAADRIEDKYLLEALVPSITNYAKKAQKNSALAYWKAQGYYETMIGQSVKTLVTGQQSFREKVNEVAGYLAGKADDITWGAIYRAAELKISKTRPDLAYDSKEYTDAVVELFEDVIDHTQVIDTIFHKSQVMRSANPATKTLTAFMAEPTLTLNMTAYRIGEAYNEWQKGNKAKATKIFTKITQVLITNALMVSFAQSLFDALRDDDEDKFLNKLLKYWFGIGKESSIKEILLSNFVDNLNPLNWMPVAKEIMSWVQGYDASNMYVDGIYSGLDSLKEIYMIATGESTKTGYGKLYTVAKGLSQASGLPLSNAIREVRTLHNNVNDLWGGEDWISTKAKQKERAKTKQLNDLHDAFDKADSAQLGTNSRVAAMNDIKTATDAMYQYKYEQYLNDSENPKTPEEAAKAATTQTKTSITNEFKPIYRQLVAENRTNEAISLKNNLIVAYNHLGDTNADKDIDKWIKK